MTEQDKTSSQDHVAGAASGADAKRPAASGSVVTSRPVAAGDAAKAQPDAAKPAIDSTLVGKPDATVPAAGKKPATADTPAKASESASSAAKPATTASPDSRPVMSKPADTKPADAKPVLSPPPGPGAAPAAATSSKAQPAPRRGGFFPTFLGGVVAAGLGAGACYWAIPHLPAGWQPKGPELTTPEAQLDAARQAATEAARSEFQTQSDALATRAAEAGADAARQLLADSTPSASVPAAAGAPAALPADLTEKLAALEKTVADLGGQVAAAAPAADADAQAALAALTSRIEQQQARLDELAARPTVDPATAAQVQTLAQQAQELQQSTEAANRRAQAATAASALMTAIESGAPRDQALTELRNAGVEVPAVLAGEVPRLSELRAEFPTAARAGLKVARESAGSEGTMTALGNFLRVQTGARSIEPREGSDPDAVLSRANAAVEAGDIAGAVAEIGTLPEPAQQAMATWLGRAKTWLDANAALAALAAGAQ